MATDRSALKAQEAGALGTYISGGTAVSDPIGTVAAAHSEHRAFTKASDDAMASTTTSETYTGMYIPRAAKLNGITYVATTGGITADDANYATVTVYKRDSAAANQTALATLTTTTTSSGSVTQGAGKGLVLATTTAVSIAAGSTITYAVAKASSGVVVRAGVFTLDLEWV